MRIFRELDEWRQWRSGIAGGSLGFVPTMGALHDGHAALMRRCVAENDLGVVSILVNPTQFDDPGDLAAYPSVLDDDLARCRELGVRAVLAPTASSVYPDDYRYRVTESDLSRRFCGAHRPGHFDGMLTVVLRLFNLVRPDRAYFGEKDYQQLRLVQGMVDAFFLDIDIVAHPTEREADGLALSSRNRRLVPEQRRMAAGFPRILRTAANAGEARSRLQAAGFVVDYVDEFEQRRLGAVRLGDTRLIDNVLLEEPIHE